MESEQDTQQGQIVEAEEPAVPAAKADSVPANQGASANPMQLLDHAIQAGVGVEQMTKLMELQERYEANEARKAYHQAMAAFKANPPQIRKNARVSYGSKGGKTEYDHATLDHVSSQISAAMSPHGLSFAWDTSQNGDGSVTVRCVITHELGHSESTTLSAQPDNSGGKNGIQQIGSTVTYLQRYTLLAATGLAASGQDDDGMASEQQAQPEPVTGEQVAEIKRLMEATGSDWGKALVHWKVDKLEDMSKQKAERAIAQLRQKEQNSAPQGGDNAG